VGTATGEFEVVQEKGHYHQPPPVEEICQVFAKVLVKWKDETANCCCLCGKVSRSGTTTASLHLISRVHRFRKFPD